MNKIIINKIIMNLKLEFIKRINTTKNSIFYSLIRYKDEILGFARNHNNKREIKKIKLDDNFNIIEDNCNEIDLIKGEDPICFIYYNKLYILDNYIDDMYLYDYEDNKYIKLLIDGKNPSFIIHNNEIYIWNCLINIFSFDFLIEIIVFSFLSIYQSVHNILHYVYFLYS